MAPERDWRDRAPWVALVGGLLLLAAIALSEVGGGNRSCTLIGCESELTFELSDGLERGAVYDVEACLDDECQSAVIEVPAESFAAIATDPDAPELVLEVQNSLVHLNLGDRQLPGEHRARLELRHGGVRIAEADTTVVFERSQPNGEGCEPVCWRARVTV